MFCFFLNAVKDNVTTALGTAYNSATNASTEDTIANAIAEVQEKATTALKANGSAYATTLAAIDDAKAATKVEIYDAINTLIEAKDQYGVNIAETTDTVDGVKVNVTSAKDAADKDILFDYVSKNGTKDAAFDIWSVDSKADIKLTFDGGFVFSAKAVGVKGIKTETVTAFAANTVSSNPNANDLYTALAAKITDTDDEAKLVKITVGGTNIDKNSTSAHGATVTTGSVVVYTFSTGEKIKVTLS